MRADKFFAEKFGSRTKAKDILKAGRVLKNGRAVSPDEEVSEGDLFTILDGLDFVSNGGKKLERGLSFFAESVEGAICADLGASTGGFTDCLLRRGAKRVYAVDVGESQLDGSLASDPRVVVMDRTNARYLTGESFAEQIEIVVSDLSFISLRLVLPAIKEILPEGGKAFVLFKPQFECEGKGLGKSGILPQIHHKPLLSDFYNFAAAIGLAPRGIVCAPVLPRKNIEYIVFLQKSGKPQFKHEFLLNTQKIF